MQTTYLDYGRRTLALVFMTAALCAVQAEAQDDECLAQLQAMRAAVRKAEFSFTAVVGNASGMESFSYARKWDMDKSTAQWKNLTGEVTGYALRDGSGGFDFNLDRGYRGPLTWHPTRIFDRLTADTELKDYACVLTGRTRLSGYKATVMRLAPHDDLRYSFIVATDDATGLPVELDVLAPEGYMAMRISAFSLHKGPDAETADLPLPGAFTEAREPAPPEGGVWPELRIPPVYELRGEGVIPAGGDQRMHYQDFSDGVTDFRVYRGEQLSMMMPAVQNGILTVMRRKAAPYEYAVTGEVPLVLAEYVLSKLGRGGQ